MPNRSVATITIIALSLLAVCCQMIPAHHLHDMVEHLHATAAHLLLLTMDVPLVTLAATLLVVLFALTTAQSIPLSRLSAAVHVPTTPPPDILCATPLRLALVGGLLNPKLF